MKLKNIHGISLASIGVMLLLAAPFSLWAQSSSLIFERAEIRIDSPPLDERDKNPKPTHPPLRFDVEVRGEDALKLEYIHTLNTLNDSSGIILVLDSPSIAALPFMKVYTPVDVLFVADDGTILQISPNIVLGELTQNVQAKAPIKAWVFIKAGAAAIRGIHPRDTIAGHMFLPPLPSQE